MSQKLFAPLWIKPQSSRYLQVFLIVTHGLAGLALLLTSLPLLVLGLSLVLLASSLAWQWRRGIGMDGRGGCRQIYWDGDRQWHLQDGRSHWHRPEQYRVIWNHPAIILLQFPRMRRGPASLLLLADQLPAELHRQLRLRLTLFPVTQFDDGGT